MRRLRCIFAILWFVWTGMIIPGHTRGVIPIAGKSCCSTPHGSKSKDAPKNPNNCAICALAAKLTAAQRIAPLMARLGFLETTPPPQSDRPSAAAIVLPRQCRDPPAA